MRSVPARRNNHFFKHLSNILTSKLFRNEDTAKAAFKGFLHSKTNDFYIFGIMKLVNCEENCVEL
ncbi:Histone-lysine N-methyltransferase SETMAR [Habropoda laboriosa]|uniref:Histone-lysine N-methyltransferase SETMAR n=1 Tax=Habropoda laboriosa TaxID=597456 RepID=A0A0L7QKE9_9HYME|nr:Histone-lysine N-methyltransferase SETMAR [Habropoda laboriosa]